MMHRYQCSICLIFVFVTAQFFLFACAGIPEIPESERKYIEGIVVKGGINAFIMKSDKGKTLRFEDRKGVEYDPPDFHAYYGDRVRVAYFTEKKGDKERPVALKIALLTENPDRINFRFGEVEGIVRASGMWRYLVYLPKNDMTVALYKKMNVKRLPANWHPEAGNKVRAFISEDSGLFVKKYICKQINRLGEDLFSIDDNAQTGIVKEIIVHRRVHRAPDRFAFQLENGETLTMNTGGETRLFPEGLKVETGRSYSIEYYRLLMGDQSIRYVATRIYTR